MSETEIIDVLNEDGKVINTISHPSELRADVQANTDAYALSFIVEFDKAVEGYRDLA